MEPIYHLVDPRLWQKNPDEDYAPESLADDGFIHCAFAGQVARAANRFYASAPSLELVELDPKRLTSRLRVEPPSPSSTSGELFPHIYGPIQRTAVVAVHALNRNQQGQWIFPH